MLIFVRCASVLLIVQPFVRDFHITEEVIVYPYVLDPVTGIVFCGLVDYDFLNEFMYDGRI